MQLSIGNTCISWFGLILNWDMQSCIVHATLQFPTGSLLTASTVSSDSSSTILIVSVCTHECRCTVSTSSATTMILCTLPKSQITNLLAIFPDADHGGDQRTRRSLSCVLTVLIGVAVDYKMEQQGCMSLSSTNTEIHATFAGTKRAVYFFEIAKFLDMLNARKLIRIYQDSQPCIDTLTSSAVSKHDKHIAMLVNYVYKIVVKGIVNMKDIP